MYGEDIAPRTCRTGFSVAVPDQWTDSFALFALQRHFGFAESTRDWQPALDRCNLLPSRVSCFEAIHWPLAIGKRPH